MKFEDVQLTGSLNITGSFNVPFHTDYPNSPTEGDLFYHTVSGSLFVRNDDEWILVPFSGSGAAAEEQSQSGIADIEYLVVAGGGSGASSHGGGGGAGGLLSSSLSSIESGSSITVTVGAGASNPGSQPYNGLQGGNSSIASSTGTSFSTVTSTGGGGGAYYFTSTYGGSAVLDGGSGGGGSYTFNGGSGIVGQGNDGGSGYSSGGEEHGGGGGGASQVGEDAPSTTAAGDGGDGKQSSITGTSTYYAGGGGGGVNASGGGTSPGTGGQGGGGNAATGTGNAGTANTGGGGSGGYYPGSHYYGGAGGSGVVILAYPSSSINGWGGQEGDAGNGRRYHKFNVSDTFIVGNPGDKNLPTGSLFCHYDFADVSSYSGTGTTVTDLSGNGNNATLTSANFTNQHGGGTVLAGARYFTTSYTGNTIGNIHSTSLWVYLDSFDGDFVGWSTKASAVGFANYNFFIDADGDVLYGDKNNSNAFQGARADTAVSADNLYHIVGTQDWTNTESKVYINGVLMDTNSSFAGSFRSDYGSVVWFARPFSEANNRADATIYNAMIYQRVLSQEDVTQIYNAQRHRFGV